MFPYHFSIFITTILISGSLAGDSPEYDYSYSAAGGDFGECKYTGSISTRGDACKKCDVTRTDFKQGGDLTWKMLLSTCPELIYGNCTDEQDYEMEDLVWYDNRCSGFCPRCPCQDGDDTDYYIHNYTRFEPPFEVKICYECECNVFFNDDNNDDVYARDCREESTFDSVDELEESNIQCPDMTASPTMAPTGECSSPDPSDNTDYDFGDTFFYDDGVDCQYCRCNSSFGLECANLVNVTDNENLKYLFLDECANSLADCWNTTDESITDLWALNNDFCSCPYCACGTYSLTDLWKGLEWNEAVYDTDDGTFDYALYDCVDCDCVAANINNVNLEHRACSSYDAEERDEADCTASDDLLECMQESNGDVPDGPNDVQTCWDDTFDTYCGFRKIDMTAENDPDVVCVEEDIEDAGNWDCVQNYLCEAVFSKTELEDAGTLCLYNEGSSFTVKSYDCVNYKWLGETYKVNMNFSCCTTDNCNDQSEWNDCDSNSVAADLLAVRMECEYGDHGVGNSDFIKYLKCGKALPADKYEVCDIIGDYWKWVTACDCRYYAAVKSHMADDDKSKETKQALQLKFDEDYAWTKYSLGLWNDAYECNKKFECDGVGAKKVAVLAMIGAVLLLFL